MRIKLKISLILFLAIFSSISHAESLTALSKDLARGASSLKTKKVAVLTFPYHDGRISSGSTIVSERLTTDLVGRKGIRVIERRLIEKLMSEQKLSQSGVINAENLKTIGTVLDADAIVTGTLIDMPNNKTEINARLIRVESGEMLAAGQDTIERTWKDTPCYPEEKKVEPTLAPVEQGAAVVPTPEPQVVNKTPEPVEPVAAPMRQMHLSNESFPDGRRNYYENEPVPDRRAKKPLRKFDLDEREDYQALDDFGAIGPVTARPAPPKKGADAFAPTLKHPTAIGVVRSESTPASRPSYSRRRPRKR